MEERRLYNSGRLDLEERVEAVLYHFREKKRIQAVLHLGHELSSVAF